MREERRSIGKKKKIEKTKRKDFSCMALFSSIENLSAFPLEENIS